MIEETLAQYGILGVWTLTLLYNSYKYQSETKQLIKNNTIAMTKVYEVVKTCPNTKA